MKRHLQKTGVRKFFGQDLIDLQAEPLKALDSLFAEYGACIITGCEVSVAASGTFDVAPGLVALEATDPETGVISIKTMPFEGAQGVAMPLYLTGQHTLIERVYGDGKVKPIAYNYHAVASGIPPTAPHLTITQDGNNRFVDVLQDEKHSFITASERVAWNKILSDAKGYTDSRETAILAAADTKAAAALRSSKEYTDTTAVAVRSEMATADTKALRDAKSYADTIVAALVSSSPEALNTLQELAAALGNDPNFATTVMNEIGRRATTEQVDAAVDAKVATKANINGDPTKPFDASALYTSHSDTDTRGVVNGNFASVFDNKDVLLINWGTTGGAGLTSKDDPFFVRYGEWIKRVIYHTGNFNPASKADLHGNLSSEFNAFALYVSKNNAEFKGVIDGTYSASLNSNDVLLANWSPTGAVGLLSKEDPYFVRYGDLAKKQTIYHTGNVNMATPTAHGFMSAADKTKLDAMSPVKIYARGKVSADGGHLSHNGLINISTEREPGYKEGVYRLTHNLGLIGHCTFISLIGRKNQSLTYRVDTEMGSHTVIRVHDMVNYNNYTDCEFSYVIMA